VGRFIGTYNLTLGGTIVVNKPIVEKLQLSINNLLLEITAIIIVIVIIMLILRKRR